MLCGTVYPPAVVLCGTVCPLCHTAHAAILYFVAQGDVCYIWPCTVLGVSYFLHASITAPPPSLRQAVSDAELLSYYDRLLEHRPRLEAFSVLRAALAPVIEAVILLDRLVYLLEQVCHTAGPAGVPTCWNWCVILSGLAGTGVSYGILLDRLVYLLEQVSYCWTG